MRAVVLGGLAGVVAALVVLLPATRAAACSCAEVGPVDEATLAEFDAAFTGVVTGNEAVDDRMLRRELVVEVDEVFAGSVDATQLVVTHAQTSACGIDPAVGTEALFLVHEGPSTAFPGLVEAGELEVASCGGQRAASEASALGAGRPPEQAAPGGDGEGVAVDDDLGSPGWVPVGGLALALAVVLTIAGSTVALTSRARRARRTTEA